MSRFTGGLMNIISCKEAKAQGLKRYFTGKPCKRGHIAERHVSGGCVVCSAEDCKSYYAQDPQKYMQGTADYRERNRSRCRDIQKRYYEKNSHLIKASASTHRGQRALRIPCWSELDKIAEFYLHCPEGHEVDHIYPLQGKTVSGLHVLGNLQYLPRSENRSKHNKFPEGL